MNKELFDRIHGRSDYSTFGDSEHRRLMGGKTGNGMTKPQLTKIFTFEQIKLLFKKWKKISKKK
jgi:hypothetical protein